MCVNYHPYEVQFVLIDYKGGGLVGAFENKESGVLLSEEERIGLTRMKECIKKDPDINSVYVFEVSRLSRNQDVIYSVRKFLIDHQIQLVVLNPKMTLFDKNGNVDQSTNLVFSVFSALSEPSLVRLTFFVFSS